MEIEIKKFFFAISNIVKRNTAVMLCTLVMIGLSVCATAQVQNSVALKSIISPVTAKEAGSMDTVTVIIRNMGTNDLDSCYIFCEMIMQEELVQTIIYIYHNVGGLPSGIADTVTSPFVFCVPPFDYEVCVWVSMPNGITDSIINDDTLCVNFVNVGIEKTPFIASDMRVYPNPANGQLTISLPNPSEGGAYKAESIEIYDIYGKLVLRHCERSEAIQKIDISHLTNGIYFLKINEVVKKIVKF